MSSRVHGGAHSARRFTPTVPRPAVLGVSAFVAAFLIARVAYERTLPTRDMVVMDWWHGGGGHAHGSGGAGGPGTYLALSAAALYLLLPLLVLASHAGRAFVTARRGTPFMARTVLAALTATAAALVCVPVTALALALSPYDGAGLWDAVRADAVTVLRYCLPTGLLLSVAFGVSWAEAGPSHRPTKREVPPC
ncbi:hypothetical protein PUR28_04360 [Streptomyces sp. BE308]|uniref:hypothetical protein n=1 Tax=Streptomyces sp. BE308 TaxID=3002529 RepID=UPI002E75C4E4|nr:hypothetical protein [Streptomyces sp. BE308]MEE1790016.1 hypothetical protein [Streptomyces sp. BE308]